MSAWKAYAEGAVALFEQAEAWLRRERLLLPRASVLARLVSSVREEAGLGPPPATPFRRDPPRRPGYPCN